MLPLEPGELCPWPKVTWALHLARCLSSPLHKGQNLVCIQCLSAQCWTNVCKAIEYRIPSGNISGVLDKVSPWPTLLTLLSLCKHRQASGNTFGFL